MQSINNVIGLKTLSTNKLSDQGEKYFYNILTYITKFTLGVNMELLVHCELEPTIGLVVTIKWILLQIKIHKQNTSS